MKILQQKMKMLPCEMRILGRPPGAAPLDATPFSVAVPLICPTQPALCRWRRRSLRARTSSISTTRRRDPGPMPLSAASGGAASAPRGETRRSRSSGGRHQTSRTSFRSARELRAARRDMTPARNLCDRTLDQVCDHV